MIHWHPKFVFIVIVALALASSLGYVWRGCGCAW
jgi:hypothetical protein